MTSSMIRQIKAVVLLGILPLGACSTSNGPADPLADPLADLGPVITSRHTDGNGLLAGLGLSGLREAPEFYTDPSAPTVGELRRQAIHTNYTALIDQSAAGGYGTLYGLTDDTTFPGTEHLAFFGSGINRATLMVQVPDSFDPAAACIVVAPSSGSRGVYGAVATGGEWGLNKGCAVAYTDANKGTGAVELTQRVGFGLRLQRLDIDTDSAEATFVVPSSENVPDPGPEFGGVELPTAEELAVWADENPNRYAFKHAHSQKNIERDWGRHAIESVEFAFKVLNDSYDSPFDRDNTLVLGASVSNGGGALLRAAEAADNDVFDGLVVGEPNINPAAAPAPVSIEMADRDTVTDGGKPAYEYFLAAELFAACAAQDPANAGALFANLRGDTTARCEALINAGLLARGTPAEAGAEATQKLLQAGYLVESSRLLVGYAGIDLFQSLLATYGNAYTRSSVIDNLCDISMGHVAAGETAPSPRPSHETLAALSNGIPRTVDIFLIKDDAPGGPSLQFAAASSNGEFDYNFEGAQCWRDIYTNPDNPLHERLQNGIEEIRGNGNLNGVPTIIVHGRSDALIPVNHSSRPYFALNRQVEGDASQLYYYEIKNAQHLDTLNPTYATAGMSFVPIDYYFKQALDLLYSHLTEGDALPPSQVVQATPPTGGAVTPKNLVPISDASVDLIRYDAGVLTIPD